MALIGIRKGESSVGVLESRFLLQLYWLVLSAFYQSITLRILSSRLSLGGSRILVFLSARFHPGEICFMYGFGLL